jgi:DNA ligase (NAD+)
MKENIKALLDLASKSYYTGRPIMSDDEFDKLAELYSYDKVGAPVSGKKAKHRYPMYSLLKVVDWEKRPLTGDQVATPKLDGSAISLLYSNGILIRAATRGDGVEGEDITDKVYLLMSIPKTINQEGEIQVTGEIVLPKYIKNSRNLASGALHTKDLEEFKGKAIEMTFLAYDLNPYITDTYTETLALLKKLGFSIVSEISDIFPTDGEVFRLNDNNAYINAGFTSKHPRGAFALKKSSDVAVVPTKLLDVKWQVGKTGKVTPVAIFDEIVIDDAKINKATLNNVGFIEAMELEIGDTILVTRSNSIIPKILGKE